MQSFEDRPLPEEPQAPATRASFKQDLRVTAKDLVDFGYTDLGCPRCEFMRTHGSGRGCGYAHGTVCRNRIKRDL